jgi:hypothetical protein
MNHKELTAKAVIWLAKKCCVVGSELCTQSTVERPDVLGWNYKGISFCLEVKTSYADFKADAKKPFRLDGGVGDFRYFVAPEGVIPKEELPKNWGLLELVGGSLREVKKPRKIPPDLITERAIMVQIIRASQDAGYRKKHNLRTTWIER